MKKFAVLFFAGVAMVATAGIDPPAPSGCGAINWTDRAVRRKAILETAYAYYLKADCVQYGSVPLVVSALYKDVGWLAYSRRNKECTPEDATPDSTYYTVCSSFPYETYYNAIGYKLSGASDTSVTIVLTTRPQDCVVFDYDKRLDPDGSKYEPEMMRLRSLLEPGDVLVYSNIKQDPKTGQVDGGGHALMYVGDVAGDGHPMVMHSGGAKYQFENGGYDQVEKSGTIRLDDFDACFFHGPSMTTHTKIMAFRPLDLPAEKYPLSESAKARYLHPRLRIDRCVDVGPYGSVVTGGELNYSITLQNFSKVPYTVPVSEKVPEGCALVSYTALPFANNQLSTHNSRLNWDVPLAPGEKRTLKWCVKVTAPAGSKVVATGGTAADIPSNTLVTEVVPRRISAAVARAWAEANIHNVTNLPDCRVAGWAGGRRSKNPPRMVRNRDPHARQLMEGDVVVVSRGLSRPKEFRLWVKGRDGLEEMTPQGIRWVTEDEVASLLAKDLFVALRPAALPSVEDFIAREKAVVATAFAYYRKREFVQAAPTGAVAEALGYVPKYGEPPEAAGPAHTIYQTPVSFVNDVYLNSIGYSLCDPATTTVSNLVETPPPGIVMFEYDCRKDPEQKRFWGEMKKMWSIIEPGDVVAFMTDHPSPKKKKPGRCHVVLYVGDTLKDGHAQMLHVSGDGAEAASVLGRTNGCLRKSLFDGLLHGRNSNYLKDRTKVVVLRPLAKAK
ncbi:MAG: hypothetical protein IJH50_10865 [Kiritimatiellae bacterium]|nr:hypothetical protein [Kiritimatiellia bacterium]